MAATPGARYGCVIMAKIIKASAVSKPPLSPTVSAVISDFVNKLAEEKTIDADAHARLKKALFERPERRCRFTDRCTVWR